MSVAWLVVLAVGVGLFALVLFTPIRMHASCVVNEDELRGMMELCWGPRLVTVQIGSGADGRVVVLRIPTVRVASLFETRKDEPSERGFPKIGRLRRVDLRVLRAMLLRGVRATHPSLYVRGAVGLGDPADTALMLTALRHVEHAVGDRVRLEILDDFCEDVTELVGRVEGWIVPAEIMGILALWMVRSDTRRMLLGD